MKANSHNRALGAFGERMAVRAYRRSGHKVLAKNWRVREGELDVITLLKSGGVTTICFVEVKTRTNDSFGSAAEAVNWKKQNKIRSLSMLWLAQNNVPYDAIRFDVAEVNAQGGVKVLEDCF